ncbi:hypothetical protein [Comamonas endophytica]|uniref:Uncharacterized protein n=1 Tax=Comamonas endophytica TaxID=2949090 RepID=A0ABY6GGX2_9BURK|nr:MULTISPECIES: hypothetical protein [unclassified Acidovorax]MCD2513303.1 hypothetical protein [Acidovorax sp. D4N7]UYG53910.1 hypothetical protein M9799_18435 [Acidovorax sp. 5MLIR]
MPPDFDTFELPPSVFGLVAQEFGGLPRPADFSAWLARHREGGAPAHHPAAQAAEQPAEPNPPGAWSPEPAEVAYREFPASADARLAAMESLDLGLSGHEWARRELDSEDSSHTSPAAAQPGPAAEPYYLTRLQLLQAAIGQRQVEPGADDAAAAGEVAEMADMPELDGLAAPEAPEVPEGAFSLDALDAPEGPDAPMTPDAPATPEAVLLEDAAEAPLTPVAGLLGAMALAGLIGLQPEGFSGF